MEEGFPLSYTRNGTPEAAVRDREDLRAHQGQGDNCHRGRAKPDVDRAVLQVPRTPAHHDSGGLGTMGYGFPAGIGAQAAFPDMLVVDIAGDGSIQMNIQELATAVQYGLPVKVVILNNGCLGMVRQWQELFYEKRYAISKLECLPNFVKLAEAYGAVGYEIEHETEVDKVLKKAFANGRPTLVDVHVNPEEGVYPIVPAGAALSECSLLGGRY